MDTQNYKLPKIFPVLPADKYKELKIDEDSYKYITSKEVAHLITKICCKHLLLIHKNPLKCSMLDYTAGVGGNVLSFSNYFKNVVAIEIDKERYEFLLHNLNIYECNNVLCVNMNAIEYNKLYTISLNPDIIFIDIPWGAAWSKTLINYKIGFDAYEIFEDFIIDIFKTLKVQQKIIALKLPKNYDIKFLYGYIKEKINVKIFLYVLHKMIILIVVNQSP